MGEIVRFPGHARTSATTAGSLKPKMAGVASLPAAFRASVISKNFSAGISRRKRQLLTAGDVTPASVATAAFPPSASMTSSTEVSIPLDTSHTVKLSSLHTMGIVTNCELGQNVPIMRSISHISARLIATQKAIGIPPAELCRQSGITPTQWSQFIDPKYKRRITLESAYKLRDGWGLTLDWIYDGDPSGLPNWLAAKLKKGKAA